MCYLVAKDKNKHGCYALKTEHGQHLADLKEELDDVVMSHGIQLVTISRPSAFGEYAPYNFISSEEEFKKTVLAMID